MIPVVDAATMNRIDQRAQEEYGLPALLLMEHAGLNAWHILRRSLDLEAHPAAHVVFVVGPGNNGGDAAVMARACAIDSRHHPSIVHVEQRLDSPTAMHIDICRRLGIRCALVEGDDARRLFAEADWIVDGLLGCGLRGAARDSTRAIIAAINDSPAKVCAVDLPSGLGDEFCAGYPTVRANMTIAMELTKRCCYYPAARLLCGSIAVASAGFPPQLVAAEAVADSYPETGMLMRDAIDNSAPSRLLTELLEAIAPSPAAYKQNRGVVDVYAGSRQGIGAAILCADAVAAAGAGLVHMRVDPELWASAAAASPATMTHPHKEGAAPAPVRRDHYAIVVGPGWGRSESRGILLRRLLATGAAGVIDADGIQLLAAMDNTESSGICNRRWVITPHPGEFLTLHASIAQLDTVVRRDSDTSDATGDPSDALSGDPLAPILLVARHLQAVVVLKGHVTWIGTPDGSCYIHDGCRPYLATGGSGDVLAGIIGALISRGLDCSAAAAAGVLAHSMAGDAAWQRYGWFEARQLIPSVRSTLARHESQPNHLDHFWPSIYSMHIGSQPNNSRSE